MSIIFQPTGSLDIATDPSNLPQEASQYTISSGAMQRCKNLRLDEKGVAQLRDGSTKLNTTAINTSPHHIATMGGVRYTFSGTVLYKDEVSHDTGLASAVGSSIRYSSYLSSTDQLFYLNGTDRKKYDGTNKFEWGIAAPTTVPTVAAGGAGNLTGDYNIKYTYLRKESSVVVCESDPSPPAAAAQALSSQKLTMTWTASADSQVTHVRIYRTLADGDIYYLDQDIAIGTVTIDSTQADTALGAEVETDHDRPPLGSVVIGPNYDGYCFILKDNLLYFCKPKQPEYWPTTYYVEVSSSQFDLVAACFWNGKPYVFSNHEAWMIEGTGYDTFQPIKINVATGAQNVNALQPVPGLGIFHVGSDGLYLYTGGVDQNVTQSAFDPIFRGNVTNGINSASDLSDGWVFQFKNKLYFGFPPDDNVEGKSVMWALDASDDLMPSNYDSTSILVTDIDTRQVVNYDYNFWFKYMTLDEANNRLVAVNEDGYVWELEDRDETTDGDEEIAWEIETKDFTLPTRRHFPRWAKYDVDASGASGVEAVIYLDDTAHQTHGITTTRDTVRRLIATGNGRRASIRIYGTGPIEIRTIEAE